MTSPPGRLHSVPWQIPFVCLGAIWGCSFWFIKLGLLAMSPVQVAFGRVALGMITLLLVCAITRTSLPLNRDTWKHLFVMAVLLNSVPFVLFAYGETHISSALAGIINAVTPLTAFVMFAIVFPQEKPSSDRVFGLIVGFAGVLVVLGVWNGLGSGQWLGSGACLLAVCCYGMSFAYARRFLMGLQDGPLAISAGQTVLGTLQLLPFVLLSGGVKGDVTTDVVLGMLALGALGTGVAYVFNFHVISVAGGTVASTVTYLTPLFAVGAGVLFLDESLEWYELVGAAIVLIGAAMVQGRLRVPWVAREPAVE